MNKQQECLEGNDASTSIPQDEGRSDEATSSKQAASTDMSEDTSTSSNSTHGGRRCQTPKGRRKQGGKQIDDDDDDSSSDNSVSSSDDSHTPTMDQVTQDLWSQYDPSRMQLTRQEHEWSLKVKAAIQGIPDIDALSDFMYAQLAIVSQGNVDDAVDRAYRLQEHKKNNDILDTYDHGLLNLPKDAHFLSIDYNLQTSGYTIAIDVTKTNGAIWKDPEETRYISRRIFYASHMVCCDISSASRNHIQVPFWCQISTGQAG